MREVVVVTPEIAQAAARNAARWFSFDIRAREGLAQADLTHPTPELMLHISDTLHRAPVLFTILATIANELALDESYSHNGLVKLKKEIPVFELVMKTIAELTLKELQNESKTISE